MHCQLCGYANPEERIRCSFCGATLDAPLYTGKRRLCMQALVSLWLTPACYVLEKLLVRFAPPLGDLGVLFTFLSLPISLMLAVMALSRIRRSRGRLHGTGWAAFTIVLLIAAVGKMQVEYFHQADRRMARSRMTCMANQREIVVAATIYAEDHGKYPASLFLCPDVNFTRELTCPNDPYDLQISYGYNAQLFGESPEDIGDPQQMLLCADGGDITHRILLQSDIDEKRHGRGYLAAFCDGHTAFLKAGSPLDLRGQ